MRSSVLILILLVVGCTLLLIQNNQQTAFQIFFIDINISKSVMLAVMLCSGFILGLFVAKPKRSIEASNYKNPSDIPLEINALDDEDLEYIGKKPNQQLSEEDREYIS